MFYYFFTIYFLTLSNLFISIQFHFHHWPSPLACTNATDSCLSICQTTNPHKYFLIHRPSWDRVVFILQLKQSLVELLLKPLQICLSLLDIYFQLVFQGLTETGFYLFFQAFCDYVLCNTVIVTICKLSFSESFLLAVLTTWHVLPTATLLPL